VLDREEKLSLLHGFALPLYDAYYGTQGPVGGMVGWIVAFIDLPEADAAAGWDSLYRKWNMLFSTSEEDRQISWDMLSQILLPKFARDVRHAHMLDLVEEYVSREASLEPESFFDSHIGHLTGWRYPESHEPAERSLSILFDEDRYSLPPRHLTELPDTRVSPEGIPTESVRLCKRFLELLRLAYGQRRLGAISFAHDYAKDLNASDILLDRLRSAIEKSKRIPEMVLDHELRAAIANELEDLRFTYDAAALRNRFMMAHLWAKTEGRLYEQPQWCVDRLMSGTKRGLYELIRCLVWEPLGPGRGRRPEESPFPMESEVAEWHRLYGHVDVGLYPDVDNLLSAYYAYCQHSQMTDAVFGDRHPPPDLNPADGLDDAILKDLSIGDGSRFLSPGLLPLLVFSLRTAFQHAWLSTFLAAAADWKQEVLPGALKHRDSHIKPAKETIRLHGAASDSGYRITLLFPNPLAAGRVPSALIDLPPQAWGQERSFPFGDWDQQIAHYSGLTDPWKADPGQLSSDQFTVIIHTG
jgi:hypothetical protein